MPHKPHAPAKGSKETRTAIETSKLEVRNASDGKMRLTGYATVFNTPASLGELNEVMVPGAFTQSLKSEEQYALRDHSFERLLGRKSAGTLSLWEDAHGLAFELELPDTELGRDTYQNVKLGNLRGCSIGFYILGKEYREDSKTGEVTRYITAASLFEITITPIPVFETTSVDVRSIRAKLAGKRTEDDDDDAQPCDPDSDADCDDSDCECTCSACVAGQCDECSDPDCDDDGCEDCAMQERAAHLALLERRRR